MSNRNKILIVDDEGLNIVALTHILKDDYTLFVEKDGMGCIETAKEQKPDLILLDIIMPAMNGFDVIKVLKSMPETRDIPVVFVTGLRSSQDEEMGFVLGAADYIYKPFNATVVSLRVKNQLQIVNQMSKIKHLSMTDTLTGVGNRHHFNTVMDKEWKLAVRNQTSLSFMMLDIDHFKKYNDAFGHLQGDTALKVVADVIVAKLLRPGDKMARWGGEEFAVILPITELTGALKVSEDIRSAIEKTSIKTEDGYDTFVTVSIGVHCIVPGEEGHSLEKFVAETDEALYRAKQSGRNTVCSTAK
ncbi:MAG: diguanylate cyclase [Defluviitaleaceae bacterium]|nr:diguanylate cyclase [Defluviitaleaceae bacterium]